MPQPVRPTGQIRPPAQENLLTLLCHSDEYGRLVIGLATPEMFDGVYRLIAEKAFAYWRTQDCAPGPHIADLVDDILGDRSDGRGDTIRRIFQSMVLLSDSINAEYVISDIQKTLRLAALKGGLLDAVEAVNAGADSIEAAETILDNLLRARTVAFNAGIIGLAHPDRIRAYIHDRQIEFTTGIDALDKAGAVPMRKRLLLLIGGKGRGKSWGLIHFAKKALLAGFKVAHISIENDEDECLVRYNQAIFALPIHRLDQQVALRINSHADAANSRVSSHRYSPDFALAEAVVPDSTDPGSNIVPMAAARLEARWAEYGDRLTRNLVIRQFPSNTLTPALLAGYLDTLDQVHGFVPDMLVVDTPKNMKIDANDRRGSIGLNMEETRAIGVDRNIAVIAAHQLNREGYDRHVARSTHVGEDWSVVHTADTVIVHSATDQELRSGLARLFVEHVRGGADKFEVVVTHNYAIGQFAIYSKRMPWRYDDPDYIAIRGEAERLTQGTTDDNRRPPDGGEPHP